MLIGSRVKEICAEQGISVAKIERMAGIPEKSISKWDKNVPSFDKVQRVLNALEISYEEFADIGSPETQKIMTALVKIKSASPTVYKSIQDKWLYGQVIEERISDIVSVLPVASDTKLDLIREIMQMSDNQATAFLTLAKSLPPSKEE